MIARPIPARRRLAAAVAAVALVAAALAISATAAPAQASGRRFLAIAPDVPSHAHIHPQLDLRRDNLPYGGGPVLHANRTHVIFWAPPGMAFDPGYQTLIDTFLTDVAADSRKTSNVYSLSGQYTDGAGPAAYDSSYAGFVQAADPLPPNGCTEPATGPRDWKVCLTDDQLEAEIEHVVAADHLPTTSRDVYFLVTPNGLGSCTDAASSSCALGGSASGYCGYHSETAGGIVYAVIPYNAVPMHCQSDNPRPNSSTADPTISTISHEHNEMVTDPDGDAWIDASGNEDGDLCLTTFGPTLGGKGLIAWNETVHGGHFYLQEEWSNTDSSCQPRARPDEVSFSSVHAERLRSLDFTAHGSDPQGRLVSFAWFFGDGHAGAGRRAAHTFKVPGPYRVTVRVTDSWGNWAFSSRTIRVRGR